MKPLLKILVSVIALALTTCFTSYGQVCRAVTIYSTDHLEKKGKTAIRGAQVTGSEFEKIQVYITFEDRQLSHFYKLYADYGFKLSPNPSLSDILRQFPEEEREGIIQSYWEHVNGFTNIYIYSNYKTPGFEFPTKIMFNIEEIGLDVIDYCRNIVFHPEAYPETLDLNKRLVDAANSDIKFFIDNRFFEQETLGRIDLEGIKNIQLVNQSGSNIPNGYNLLKTQRQLKELGFYNGSLDGVNGPNTQLALNKYYKSIGVENYKVDVELDEEFHKIKFSDSDEFIQYIDESNNICETELCISYSGEMKASRTCGNATLELSTTGNLKFTLASGEISYDFNVFEGAVPTNLEGCQIERGTCFSKSIKRTYSIKCGDESIEASSSGGVKLSSGNFSTDF